MMPLRERVPGERNAEVSILYCALPVCFTSGVAQGAAKWQRKCGDAGYGRLVFVRKMKIRGNK